MIPICLCVYFPLCEPLSHTQSAVMLRANREAEWVDEEDDLLFKYAQEPPPPPTPHTHVSAVGFEVQQACMYMRSKQGEETSQ